MDDELFAIRLMRDPEYKNIEKRRGKTTCCPSVAVVPGLKIYERGASPTQAITKAKKRRVEILTSLLKEAREEADFESTADRIEEKLAAQPELEDELPEVRDYDLEEDYKSLFEKLLTGLGCSAKPEKRVSQRINKARRVTDDEVVVVDPACQQVLPVQTEQPEEKKND